MALDREAWVTDVLKRPWLPDPDLDPARVTLATTKARSAGASIPRRPSRPWPSRPTAASTSCRPSPLTFSDTPRNRTRYEWLAAKWKEVLGVDVKLDPVEPTTYTALTKDIKTAPQMFILGWCADYPDPQNWLSVYWKTGGFGERIGYSNPDFDALVDQADVELDPAKRAELYAAGAEAADRRRPVAFVWNNVNTTWSSRGSRVS